jgi:hypothetical protein
MVRPTPVSSLWSNPQATVANKPGTPGGAEAYPVLSHGRALRF